MSRKRGASGNAVTTPKVASRGGRVNRASVVTSGRSMDSRRLQAQLARVRSDDWLREKARVAAELSAAERLEIAYHLCRAAGESLARQDPARIAAIDALHGAPDADAAAALRRLARGLPR